MLGLKCAFVRTYNLLSQKPRKLEFVPQLLLEKKAYKIVVQKMMRSL